MNVRSRLWAHGEAGFSVIELIVSLFLALLVTGGLYSLLFSQWHSYRLQREASDASTTVRGAAALLNWDLRQVSASSGDLYAMDDNSITIRATTGGGVVCSYKDVGSQNNRRKLGVYDFSGAMPDTSLADSAMV